MEDDEEFITYEHLICDGPDCDSIPTIRCARCRSTYYCSPECRRRHWIEHKKDCVDNNQKSTQLLQHNHEKSVIEPVSSSCGICGKDPTVETVVLEECKHGFCFQCLKYWQRDVHEKTNGREVPKCPTCGRGVVDNAEQSIKARSKIYLEKAKREDVREEDRKESLKLAVTELSKITDNLKRYDENEEKPWIRPKDVDLISVRIDKADVLLQLDLPKVAIEELEKYLEEEKATQIKSQQDLLNDDLDGNRRDDNANSALIDRVEDLHLNGVTFDNADSRGSERLVRCSLNKARALRDMSDWKSALQEYQNLNDAATTVPIKKEQNVERLMGESHCLREASQLDRAVDVALRAVNTNRRSPAVHQPLALAYESKGQIEEARKTMNRALHYEEPWNEQNTRKNLKLFGELCVAQREEEARRKKEAEVLKVWGRVIDLVTEAAVPSSDRVSSWAEIKTRKYDMLEAEDIDDEEEAKRREETYGKLETAIEAALVEEESERSETFGHDDEPASESNLLEDVEEEDADDENFISVTLDQFDHIKLTKWTLKWLQRSDAKYRAFFIRRIKQLAAGDRSRILAKNLTTNCKTLIYETYLEQKSGHRIVWTEDDQKGLLIWYVAKHKRVSECIRKIDDAENRSLRQLTSASALPEIKESAVQHSDEEGNKLSAKRIMLDPWGHTPLKLHQVQNEELPKLMSQSWQPDLFLTEEEDRIVKKPGTVLLLGRSGTGKTVCICNRIKHDRHLAATEKLPCKQLFVARSQSICKYVKSMVGEDFQTENPDIVSPTYLTFSNLLKSCESKLSSVNIDGVRPFDEMRKVEFRRFRQLSFVQESVMDPLVLWTQIRSFIKGSIESYDKGRPLSRDEYLEMGTRRCRLSNEQRQLAYGVFERYERFTEADNLWDDCDRMSLLLRKLVASHYDVALELMYTKVYVDEIQDYTQAEIALFFKLCRSGGLFFAGDPAQSVVEGVDFRFDEVRSVAYHLFPDDKRYIPAKPEIVNVNFRSHQGILNVAAGVLERLFTVFPNSATELGKDEGLFLGPRPGVFHNVEEGTLIDLVKKIDGVVLLAMHDDDVARLERLVGDGIVVLSIRDSKGLEFQDVILVDFFKGLSDEHQKPWKNLLLGRHMEDVKPEMETHLKQLYTAVTRCMRRFFFAETNPSEAGNAFLRWASGARAKTDEDANGDKEAGPLVSKQNVKDLEKMVMTPDEWNSRGVDFGYNAETIAEKAEFWLDKAMYCFRQGEDSELLEKAQTHLSSVKLRSEVDLHRSGGREFDGSKLEADAVMLLEELVKHNLLAEASKLFQLVLPLLKASTKDFLEAQLLPAMSSFDEE